MIERIELPATSDRGLLWRSLAPQITALLEGETDIVAAMANFSAALEQAFHWHWIGFYRVIGNELVLGPFQGPVACSRIAYGRGVCGSAWKQDATLIVPDVDLFPGHIACSALSRSEIVVPVHDPQGKVIAVLDIDSTEHDAFTEQDANWLRELCEHLSHCK